MKVIGLTGGIACGKSSVSKFLADKYRVPIIDADEIAHDVLKPGTKTYWSVVRAFGPSILTDSRDGATIDRKCLGAVVFKDEVARRKLQSLMNGAIAWAIGLAFLRHFLAGTPLVVLDAPLLFETGLDKVK